MTPQEHKEIKFFIVINAVLQLVVIVTTLIMLFLMIQTFKVHLERMQAVQSNIDTLNTSIKDIYSKLNQWEEVTVIQASDL